MKSLVIAFSFILLAAGLAAQDTIRIGGLDGLDPYQTAPTYPVCVALSGGGARGFAAIGVLKAFEEKGIRVAAVSGTSIGGIVGGLYACGQTPDQLAGVIRRTNFATLFTNKPARLSMFLTQRQERDRHLLSVRFDGLRPSIPQGLTAGQRLVSLLTSLTAPAVYHADGDFTRLKIPFKTVTTDIVSGKMEVISNGSLADAMRATMAFPLAFTGVERGGKLLMDGGMVAPIPVELVRQMCDTVRFVVAVNTSSPLLPKNKLLTPVDIANQVTSIMTADQLSAELAKADYVVAPTLDGVASMDFEDKDSIMAAGYRAGTRAADSIIAIITARRDTARYLISSVVPATSLLSALKNRSFRRDELVAELARAVRDSGLFALNAVLSRRTLAGDPAAVRPTEVTLEVTARVNLPRRLTTIEFRGNTYYADSTLSARMDLPDSVITPADLRRGLDRVVNQYRVDGYDLADIDSVAVDFERNHVVVYVDEAIVRRVDVENNTRTRDWVVRSYCPVREGRPYSTRQAAAAQTNIYGTDLFDRVSVVPMPERDSATVKISVEEKKHLQLRLGWHWDDEFKSEEFGEVLDDDLFGIGMEGMLHARYAEGRQRYAASARVNRIFKTYLTSRVEIYHDRLNRPLFGDSGEVGVRFERAWGGAFGFGQQIARLGTVTGSVEIKELDLRDSRFPARDKLGIRALRFESLVETFDRGVFPTTGKQNIVELELAGRFFGGKTEFTRFFMSSEAYFPVGRYFNYHPRFTVGVSRAGLPPSEQFYAGGLHSFVGYRTYQLSGDKMLMVSQEIRLRLPLRLYLTGRYDIGEIYSQAAQFRLRDLRQGIGGTLAVDLPIGPIELGYGATHDGFHRVYFNAGLAF